MYRIIIAGSRDFNNYELVVENIKAFTKDNNIKSFDEIEIISGCARGADALGIKLAERNNINCKKFPAQWDIYGRSAGYKRNVQMVEYAAEEDGILTSVLSASFISTSVNAILNISSVSLSYLPMLGTFPQSTSDRTLENTSEILFSANNPFVAKSFKNSIGISIVIFFVPLLYPNS